MSKKLKVLFLCTGNSCRSQMAEGYARTLKSDLIDALSAGTAPKEVDPRAIRVMKEDGVDISGQKSKHVDSVKHLGFDYVVTLCGGARENCPLFPGKARVIHHGFDDPPELSMDAKTEIEALNHYRRVRDQIKSFVLKMPDILEKETEPQVYLDPNMILPDRDEAREDGDEDISCQAAGHDHDHEHSHPGHDHAHDLVMTSRKMLWWAMIVNLVFLVVEVIGGILANSLALLADAGHMLTDVAALALALVVSYLAARPATPNRTFGLLRAEVLGAFVNGATLVLIVGLILREAWHRLGQTQEINGPLMLGVAVAGLLANLGSAWILSGGRKENVNVEGAFLHMMADALGSVGAIIAGVVIWTTGWLPIDPITSVVISLLILYSSWGLIKRTMNILLEATPENIDYNEVLKALSSLEHVYRVHDLHIWTISSGKPVLSAHITLSACCADTNHWQDCLSAAQTMLEQKFGISHSTLQVEPLDEMCEQRECKLL